MTEDLAVDARGVAPARLVAVRHAFARHRLHARARGALSRRPREISLAARGSLVRRQCRRRTARASRLASLAVALSACASERRIAVRVRDPLQIAVVRPNDSGDVPVLPARVTEVLHSCIGRDALGFPLLCARGGWLVDDDTGTLAVVGSVVPDGGSLRVRTTWPWP